MKAFKIVGNTGFHIRFPNGYSVSIQFGPCTYSDNHGESFVPRGKDMGKASPEEFIAMTRAHTEALGHKGADEVEVAVLDAGSNLLPMGRFIEGEGDTVAGYKTVKEVLELLNIVEELPQCPK